MGGENRRNALPIRYIEKLPVVSIDENGIGVIACSGDETMRFRISRSFWRKLLETELRRLNEFEMAERADRGRVIPMERKRSH